jgi:hypothetical protein
MRQALAQAVAEKDRLTQAGPSGYSERYEQYLGQLTQSADQVRRTLSKYGGRFGYGTQTEIWKRQLSEIEGQRQKLIDTGVKPGSPYPPTIVLRPRAPTKEELAQAAEGYVAAAQAARAKGERFEARIEDDHQDLAPQAREEQAKDIQEAARLYERSAAALGKLAAGLRAEGDEAGAMRADDKAQNTRTVAQALKDRAERLR